eukprot:SM000015S01207  [mRNA]  locus=s15:510135:511922:+ [translate_table: standard]
MAALPCVGPAELGFVFPLTLSTVHFVVSALGAQLFLRVLKVRPLADISGSGRDLRWPLIAFPTVLAFARQLRPLVEVKAADHWTRVFPMAVVFCINIVLGNVSLSSIPVSFMQTIKSFTPATTSACSPPPAAPQPLLKTYPAPSWGHALPMHQSAGQILLTATSGSLLISVLNFLPFPVLLQRLVWGRQFDVRVYLSLLPVVGGIVITSVTELSFVWKGFIAAMAGCFVTSTKTILAESILHGKYNFDSLNTVREEEWLPRRAGLSQPPSWSSCSRPTRLQEPDGIRKLLWWAVVYYMAPYATALLIVPAALFEGPDLNLWLLERRGPEGGGLAFPFTVLLVSGVIAFSLNYSIFYVIQTTSALTFNVAGNMKTAVAIAASWLLFRNPMSWLNVAGCGITLLGCTVYGYVRQRLGSRAVIEVTKEELPELLPLLDMQPRA